MLIGAKSTLLVSENKRRGNNKIIEKGIERKETQYQYGIQPK